MLNFINVADGHVLNLYISSIALMLLVGQYCWVVFGNSRQSKQGIILFLDRQKSPGTHASYILWCGWWFALCLSYIVIDEEAAWSVPALLFSVDSGNYLMIASSAALCMAEKFSWKRLLRYSIFFIPFVWWDTICVPFSEPSMMLLKISPSILLSCFASIVFGWTFVVRWKHLAFPFFIITCLYGILQIQAYAQAFLWDDLVRSLVELVPNVVLILPIVIGLNEYFAQWSDVFTYLAVGKIFFFLSYILFVQSVSSTDWPWQQSFGPSEKKVGIASGFLERTKITIEVLGIIIGATLLFVKLYSK